MDELGQLVGYQLHLVDLLALQDARTALAGMALTPAKVTAMVFVRDHPGCDQNTLGRRLLVNRSSAMKLVDKLQARGLLERRPGRDLRSNGLHLTGRAEAVLGEVLDILRRADDLLCATLLPAEREDLLHLLQRLRQGAEGVATAAMPPAHDARPDNAIKETVG